MQDHEKIIKPKASIGEILSAFWKGIRPQRWSFWIAVVSTCGVGILQIVTPLFYKRFFDVLGVGGERAALAPQLIGILVIVLGLNLVGLFLSRVTYFLLDSVESSVMARLRQTSFNYLIDHSHLFFANNFAGALVQRVGRFSRAFEKLFDTFIFNLLPLIISLVGVVIVVWFFQPIIGIIILAWSLFTIALNYYFSRWKMKYDLRSAEADSATTALLSDAVTNQNNVAMFAGSQHESQSFKETTERQAKATRLAWDLSGVFDAIQGVMIVVIEFLLFYYGIKFWEQNVITIGTFVLIQAYLISLIYQLRNFSWIFRTLNEGLSDSEEMVAILKTPHEVQDIIGAQSLVVREGQIQFKNVSFEFNKDQPVLRDINLTVHGGEKVAFIGPSGAGKSTIARLVLRMYNLQKGVVEIDGQDIQNVSQESLRRGVSFVPQDPVLFHRSLLENIRYGKRDASVEEVMEAARLAHCDEFIERLPKGYETLVGERGIKLSGGERQRVAIARAILKNAQILILDEATSSLDSHSESLIQDALDKLMKGKTTMVIAHRLSTISKMDRIIVVQNGVIAEEGKHEDLVARNESLYKYLWTLQAGGFIKTGEAEEKEEVVL